MKRTKRKPKGFRGVAVQLISFITKNDAGIASPLETSACNAMARPPPFSVGVARLLRFLPHYHLGPPSEQLGGVEPLVILAAHAHRVLAVMATLR